MISKKLEKAINEQIKHELYSEYLYMSMQAWFAGENLDGMASWMEAQSQEERFHAMKFFRYLLDRGGKIELKALEKPPVDFKNPLNAFKEALRHEQFVTGKINELMDLACEENDHASKSFIQWFVDEQVEEEATAEGIVRQLEMIKDNTAGIYMINAELGKRTFTAPDTEE